MNESPTRPRLFHHPLVWGVGVTVVLALIATAAAPNVGGFDKAGFVGVLLMLLPICIGTAFAVRASIPHLRESPKLRFAWIAWIGIVTLIVGVKVSADWTSAIRYAEEGNQVEGEILQTKPGNRRLVVVGYKAGETSYELWTRAAHDCEPKQKIPVYYFKSTPAEAFLVLPKSEMLKYLMYWLVLTAAAPFWLIAVMLSGDSKKGESELADRGRSTVAPS